jgi:L-seryl-tRNA(Ser) seleniumtransferase
LAAGVDIVTASGDKLLGGPQAGLILGRADLINQIKKHPLIRAFRVDKTTLAALQATLLAYLEDKALEEIPVWRMIALQVGQLKRRVQRWKATLSQMGELPGVSLRVVDSLSTVGGGSLPGQTLPTKALAISVSSVEALAERLRRTDPPLIGRIEDNQLLLDPRTVLPEQDKVMLAILSQILSETS